MGMAAQLRQAFLDAQDYQQKAADYEKKKADAERDKKPLPPTPKRDLKLEALLPYLAGQEARGPGRRRPQRSARPPFASRRNSI